MTQYWLNWLTDVSLVLVVALVISVGVWAIYRLWKWAVSEDPWD